MWSIFPSPPPPLPTPRPAHSPPLRQPWPRRYGASRRVAGSPAYRCEKHTTSDHRRCRPCTKPAQSTDADSRRLGFPDEAYAPPWKMWATSYRRRHRLHSLKRRRASACRKASFLQVFNVEDVRIRGMEAPWHMRLTVHSQSAPVCPYSTSPPAAACTGSPARQQEERRGLLLRPALTASVVGPFSPACL